MAALLALLALAPRPAGAAQATLERAGPVPVLRLAEGGGLLAVTGVVVPAGAAGAGEAVAAWLARGSFGLAPGPAPAPDRHGRARGSPERDGASLAAVLVEGGLALAAPEGAAQAGLLAAEAAARAAGRGLWAGRAHGPHRAEAVPGEAEGRFVLVEGRIARIARTTMFWYANFGRSMRRDFTVRIPLAAERAFAAAGVDLGGLGGRDVRARGWLFEDNGPMIEIADPLWLEVLR